MPLPWKKSEVIRISRLAADLRRSPMRGGSLVVQTGFPTSLVDLFVKNRDRFNKSSGKSKSKTSSTRHVQTPSSPVEDHDDGGDVVANLAPTHSATDEDEAERGGKNVFLGVLKVFVILGLALGAAQFAWAMAATAFSLLFVEFLGNSITGFWHLKGWKKEGIVASSDDSGVVESGREETRALESDNNSISLEDRIEEVLVCETRTEQSRGGKSRANLIKKLVRRKLRHGKKPQQNLITEETAEQDSEETRKLEDEKEKEKPRKVEAESGNQRKKKKGKNSILLMMIVLCGLIGGRIPAFFVTVSWCLILRYLEKATSRFVG